MEEGLHLSDEERCGKGIDKISSEDRIQNINSLSKKAFKEGEDKPQEKPVQLSLHDNELFHTERKKKENQRVYIEVDIPAITVERVENITSDAFRQGDDFRKKEKESKEIFQPFLLALNEFLKLQQNEKATKEDERELCDKVIVAQARLVEDLDEILVGEDKILAEIVHPFRFLAKASFTQETWDKGMNQWEVLGTGFSEEVNYSNN
jgi:hypothetical protein